MKRLTRFVEVTPEGRIVSALLEGTKGYSELKSATGLSDRWLSKKLKELVSAQIVEHECNRYRLRKPIEIVNSDPVFTKYLQERATLKCKARLMAEEISRNSQVVAVILFGSVAKGESTGESDIDLLIVTEREIEDQLHEMVYILMFKYDAPVEAIIQTYNDLIANLQAGTAFSFGLLEGYEILYDRGGLEELLHIKKKEILEGWVYDEEVGAWIQKKLALTLKPLKTS